MPRYAKKKKRPQSLLMTVIGLLIALACFVGENTGPVRLPQGEGCAELYSNQGGDDLRIVYQKAIESAKESIMLAVYSLNDGKTIKALKSRAADGVDVTVIVDSKASPHAEKALGTEIKTVRRSPTGLMHLKILVVDAKQVWLGSANMSYDSLRSHGNLVVGVDNPPLAKTLHDYLRAMPKTGPPPKIPTPIRFAQLGQDGDLWFLPDNDRALKTLISTISSATTSIKVAMFTWTHPAITQAIIDACQRGVEVTCVIDNNQGSASGAEVVEKLRKSCVPTYLSRGSGLLHYKMLIVDDATLVIGSANWTRSAFTRNDDCFMILSPLNTDQQAFLQKMWGVVLHESERSLL
ncbi:MAG: phospholipase D-like domain-containing protein [Chlamydiales bacterium]|nr:phospholipase D-like domain-containing protein [Chlamydiales bacterium]